MPEEVFSQGGREKESDQVRAGGTWAGQAGVGTLSQLPAHFLAV